MNSAELARYERGVSREEAAAAVGVSVRTIGRIEAGDVKPNAATAKALADFYGVSVAAVLGIAPAESEAA